jgi:hypothetical protein
MSGSMEKLGNGGGQAVSSSADRTIRCAAGRSASLRSVASCKQAPSPHHCSILPGWLAVAHLLWMVAATGCAVAHHDATQACPPGVHLTPARHEGSMVGAHSHLQP